MELHCEVHLEKSIALSNSLTFRKASAKMKSYRDFKVFVRGSAKPTSTKILVLYPILRGLERTRTIPDFDVRSFESVQLRKAIENGCKTGQYLRKK